MGVNYTPLATEIDQCQFCVFFPGGGVCTNSRVAQDPDVPENADGQKIVSISGWCEEFQSKVSDMPDTNSGTSVKAAKMKKHYSKFVPFAKVDAAKREVWGIVTAQVPDKEREVCDYAKTKPYYEALIAEMSKATDGRNFMPLRYMHQNEAVGKGIGFDFRDSDKEIFMGFKVVDDECWKLVDEGVLTGFSHGGDFVGPLVPDPDFEGCMRYVASPAEVSLVDNPCLASAHFQYVKADGSDGGLRKFKKIDPKLDAPVNVQALVQAEVARELAKFKKAAPAAADPNATLPKKTKKVYGEDLPPSAFAYVGNLDNPETWSVPIKFSDDATTKKFIRAGLVKLPDNRVVPNDKKPEVKRRIILTAKQFGVDVADEESKMAAVRSYLRKQVRAKVNRMMSKQKDLSHSLFFIDDDLGKLAKGMHEVSWLARNVNELAYLVYCVCDEQDFEEDESSPLPAMLAENVSGLLDSLVAMAQEEAQELRADINAKL